MNLKVGDTLVIHCYKHNGTIYESSKNISAVPSHAANPLYIKDIEALNGKKN